MAAEGKVELAEVTRASKRGWHAFARGHSVNTTALAEVAGLWMGEWMADHDETHRNKLPKVLRDWLREASKRQADVKDWR